MKIESAAMVIRTWIAFSFLACNAITPGLDFVDCAAHKYDSEPVGTPIPTVIADIIVACGGDAASAARALDLHEPHAMHVQAAHQQQP